MLNALKSTRAKISTFRVTSNIKWLIYDKLFTNGNSGIFVCVFARTSKRKKTPLNIVKYLKFIL